MKKKVSKYRILGYQSLNILMSGCYWMNILMEDVGQGEVITNISRWKKESIENKNSC